MLPSVIVLVAILITVNCDLSPSDYAVCYENEYADCEGYPHNCIADLKNDTSTCLFLVTWSYSHSKDNILEVNIISAMNSGAYSSLGFSADKKMSNDFVLDCILANDAIVVAQFAWNDANKKSKLLPDHVNVTAIGAEHKDGRTHCRWEIEGPFEVKGHFFNLKDKEYYFLMATGSIRKEGKGETRSWAN